MDGTIYSDRLDFSTLSLSLSLLIVALLPQVINRMYRLPHATSPLITGLMGLIDMTYFSSSFAALLLEATLVAVPHL